MLVETEVEYTISDNIKAKSFIVYNKEDGVAQKPCIMIAPDWRGRSDFYCDIARKMAALGYIGFAIDIYGNARLGVELEDKKFLNNPLKENRPELSRRMLSSYEYIASQSFVNKEKIAAIGYCFGGMGVLDLYRANPPIKGVVSLHGLLLAPPDSTETKIDSKVLILHGYDDTYVNPNQVLDFANEMTRRKADWQIQMYGNTSHSFTKVGANDPSQGLKYDAMADKRSWAAMLYFFNEIFQN